MPCNTKFRDYVWIDEILFFKFNLFTQNIFNGIL